VKRLLAISLVFLLSTSSSISSAQDFRYRFPVAESPECKVSYSRYHHDYPAADIFTKNGCLFLAPVDGVVTELSRVDSWNGRENFGWTRGGKFVAILGDDGVRYYGSHLRSVARGIRVGVQVMSGDTLGSIGTSGSARGTPPHLHFGISWPTEEGVWWVRRGMVSPYDFLTAWQSGTMKSPKGRVMRMKARVGEVPKEPKK
jgi:murein DD-endopeptidase MepM/ murein hydrolase activator NlpD